MQFVYRHQDYEAKICKALMLTSHRKPQCYYLLWTSNGAIIILAKHLNINSNNNTNDCGNHSLLDTLNEAGYLR